MRKLLLFLAVLTMQACISVQDFGDSWAKAAVDPALDGRWKKIGLPKVAIQSVPGPAMMIFTKAGEAYDLTDGLGKRPNEPDFSVKTLYAGTGRLLMLRGNAPAQEGRVPTLQGMLIRYELQDDLYREFWPKRERLEALMDSRYPETSSLEMNHGGLIVKRFDEDAHRLLSEIAGDASYWTLMCEYRKQP
jgi:hypothetical protein